jgi:hypothetical protein
VALWRLLTALVTAAIAVLVTSVWAFAAMHGTAAEVHTRSAPSIVGVVATRAALIEADADAVDSFSSGEAQLAGPGERYQNQIAVASQSLAQVAENNVAGDQASQTIQLVEGLLVAYTGLIEQADAHYRQDVDRALGAADLWYASHLLHADTDGILAQLDTLLGEEKKALADQLSSGGMNVLWVYAWAVPVAILLALLVVTQVFLRRRFRRVVNPPLAGATALLLVLVAGMAVSLGAGNDAREARRVLSLASSNWRARQDATDLQGQRNLAELVRQDCARAGGCGETIDGFVAGLRSAASSPVVDDRIVANQIKRVDALAASAADTAWAQVLILVAALAVVALVPLGLYRRIEEYRYRAR